MTLASREETEAAALECKSSDELDKLIPAASTATDFTRAKLQSLARRVLLEDAYRGGEWVMYAGRPISNIELLIRELMEHRSWNAKVAAVELAFGKAPVVNQVEGGVEVVFKVEHDDSWIESVEEEDEKDEIVEGDFKIGT